MSASGESCRTDRVRSSPLQAQNRRRLASIAYCDGSHRRAQERERAAARAAAKLQRAHGLNVSGAPTVLVGGRPIFSAAIRSELMQARLRTAASHGQG
jgi:hypothetical protein